MRCSTIVSHVIVALLLVVPISGAAFSATPLAAVGALHQYCAELDATTHPGLVIIEQPVMTDELATFGGTAFVAQYSRADSAAGNGMLVARIKIRRLDGTVERIGKLIARQGGDGVAAEGEFFPLAVRQGETVVWRIRLRNFEALEVGNCFLLIGAIGDSSLAPD